MNGFGARLRTAMDTRGALCVGIDPHPGLLTAWGLGDDVAGLETFSMTVVEALAGSVAVLKPQSAFYERFGSAGIAVLEKTIAAARAAGALVILDAKRGDIGSTVAAYAAAYLEPASPLFADALTASPYLGFGALQPLLDAATTNGCGVFVLALTSNPEGAQLQHAVTMAGRTVAQEIIDAVRAANAGAEPLGSMGVVIGATIGATDHHLGGLNGPILAPGVGAQGGTGATLLQVFGPALPNVLPSTSRDVLAHGPDLAGLRNAARRTLAGLADPST